MQKEGGLYKLIKITLIVISYIIYSTPAIFVLIVLYKTIKETGDTKGLGYISAGVAAIFSAITLKQYIIAFRPDNLIVDFTIGNSLIGISYIFILIGIHKRAQKWLKAPKRIFIYTAYLLSFILLALLRKEFLIAVDLLILGIVISLMMASIETMKHNAAKFAKIQKGTLTTLIIFGFSLMLNFTLKSIVEIWHLPNLQLIRLISLSISLIAITVLLYASRKVAVKKISETTAHPLIKNITARFVKRIIIVLILFSIMFSILTFITAYSTDYVLTQDLKEYTHSISLDASRTAKNLQDILMMKRITAGQLTVNPEIINLSDKGKEILKNFYLSRKNEIASITRMNEHGIITYTYPFTNSIGKDISSQPHIKTLLKTYTPVLSDPIIAIQGFPAIALNVPVFKNGLFKGCVGILFNLKELQKIVITKKYKNEKIVIADKEGTIVSAPDEEMLFKNIATIFPFKESDTFTQCSFGKGLVIKYTFRPLYGKQYTAYAFIPKSDVFKNVVPRFLIFLLLWISLTTILIYAIQALYFAFVKESEGLRKVADLEYKENKSLSFRLSKLVNMFSKIDPSKSLEETSREILKTSLQIIKNGNAGSVLVKRGNGFIYTAVEGFPEELEGKMLTKDEIIPGISEKPFIIRHIYEEMKKTAGDNIREESKEALEESNTKKIKSTLEAPFIINGKYYGGIFIDNFYTENAFSEEDLKIAEAVSRLSSLFLQTKELISSLTETENKLLYLMDEFARLDIARSEEDFFKELLKIGKKLIPQADAGSCTLKRGEFYEYVALFGYKSILKELKLDIKISYASKTKEAEIVKDIAIYNKEHLSPEHLKILQEAGAMDVEQSIVAPVIVNNEFLGGIFLDSRKEGKVFTKKDIKIVTALSKLASLFVEARTTYQKLKRINTFNSFSLQLFHKVSHRSTKEDVLKKAFDILNSLYGNNLQEIGIWERKKEKTILAKYNGKTFFKLPLSTKSFEIALSRKSSVFIEKKETNHPFAQALVYARSRINPVLRIRFNGPHHFEEEEKGFIERFGREVVNLYQSFAYYAQTKELIAKYILSLGNAVSSYDPYTEWHSIRVAYLSMQIAERMDINIYVKSRLLFAAVLHDVGKIGIERYILLKPGKLTDAEFKKVKNHPVEGEKIVKPVDPEIANIIRHHHEKWDGTGYPDRLKGKGIPILARIITVADVFDAITTDRPYRKAFGFAKAMEIMIDGKGKLFDPVILDIFLTIPNEILMKKEISKENIEKIQQIIAETY